MAREILAQLEEDLGKSINPLEGLLRIGADTSQPMDVRIQCMRECLPYIFPKLQNQSVTLTYEDDPVESVSIDIQAVLMHPEMAKAAQDLALFLAMQEEAPERQSNQPVAALEPVATLRNSQYNE